MLITNLGGFIMGKSKIVIVDDSPFSIALIRDILEEGGFEVVGTVGNLQEVKDVIEKTRPDLVTMDMTLPGTDGLECTRAVHEIDKGIKVIVVSSMMDDEIVNDAKRNHVSAYIQKPVDAEELITEINKLLKSDALYEQLKSEYFSVFKEALLDGMNRMTKTPIAYRDEYSDERDHESNGIAVIIGIIGKFSGRMILDMSKETANKVSEKILKREPKGNEEVIAFLGELTNIVAGNACSILNRKEKAFGLRVAPPSVLSGDSLYVSVPNFKTFTAVADSEFGEILINVGFQRGDE